MPALVLNGLRSRVPRYCVAAVWSMFLRDEREVMSSEHSLVFETERLAVRAATEEDVELLYALWTNPQVMRSGVSARPACDTTQTPGESTPLGPIPSTSTERGPGSTRSARRRARLFLLNAREGEVLDIDSGHDGKGRTIVAHDLPLLGDGLHIGEDP